jgi:hypothetical protein
MPFVGFGTRMNRMREDFNHVLNVIPKHMVVNTWLNISAASRYYCRMPTNVAAIVDSLVESGRQELTAGVAEGSESSLAVLRFADLLRRSADRLCHESAIAARNQGASWRQVGEAVGGITPQGAEHRFSPAAKERRSKMSKMEWSGKDRRTAAR